jgi:hypothetical protein
MALNCDNTTSPNKYTANTTMICQTALEIFSGLSCNTGGDRISRCPAAIPTSDADTTTWCKSNMGNNNAYVCHTAPIGGTCHGTGDDNIDAIACKKGTVYKKRTITCC